MICINGCELYFIKHYVYTVFTLFSFPLHRGQSPHYALLEQIRSHCLLKDTLAEHLPSDHCVRLLCRGAGGVRWSHYRKLFDVLCGKIQTKQCFSCTDRLVF